MLLLFQIVLVTFMVLAFLIVVGGRAEEKVHSAMLTVFVASASAFVITRVWPL